MQFIAKQSRANLTVYNNQNNIIYTLYSICWVSAIRICLLLNGWMKNTSDEMLKEKFGCYNI